MRKFHGNNILAKQNAIFENVTNGKKKLLQYKLSVMLTDDGDKDGADLPSCEFRTRIKLDISVRDDDPLPLDRNKWEF